MSVAKKIEALKANQLNKFKFSTDDKDISSEELKALEEALKINSSLNHVSLYISSISDLTDSKDKIIEALFNHPSLFELDFEFKDFKAEENYYMEHRLSKAILPNADNRPILLDRAAPLPSNYFPVITCKLGKEPPNEARNEAQIETTNKMIDDLTKQATSAISSFNRLDPLANKENEFHSLKQLIIDIKAKLHPYRFFALPIKSINIIEESYKEALYNLASYYLAQKSWEKTCLVLIEKNDLSLDPLLIMAFFEFFSEEGLLINSKISELNSVALKNILNPLVLEENTANKEQKNIPARNLLIDIFMIYYSKLTPEDIKKREENRQTFEGFATKKRQPPVSHEELQGNNKRILFFDNRTSDDQIDTDSLEKSSPKFT